MDDQKKAGGQDDTPDTIRLHRGPRPQLGWPGNENRAYPYCSAGEAHFLITATAGAGREIGALA